MTEELSQEQEAEMHLKEDILTDESDQKDQNITTKDHLRTSQREKRSISPFNLFREDLSHFKEEMLKVFRDRDPKMEDQTSSQTEERPVSSTLDLLREDLNQLKEDVTSVFISNKSEGPKTSQLEEKPASSQLDPPKEDLGHFKDNLTGVFVSKTSQLEGRPVSSKLDLLKEDLSHLKEGVTSVFMSKDKDLRSADPKSSHTEEKQVSSKLDLLKEDLSHFKEDVTSVFMLSRDKDVRSADPKSQLEDKPVSSALESLKEDLSHFKDDIASVFMSNKSAGPKTSQITEKTNNPLSFFKDDLSNVFRFSLSKDKDVAKEEPSKTKVSNAERTEEPFNSLILSEQKTSKRAEDDQESEESSLQLSEGQTDGLSGNLSEMVNDEKTDDMKERTEDPEDSEDGKVTEEGSKCLYEMQQNEEMIPSTEAAELENQSEEGDVGRSLVSEEDGTINQTEAEEEENQKDELKKEETNEKEEKEEKTEPMSKRLLSLTSMISLFNLRDQSKDNKRDHEREDTWSVKNFACYLTLDPNTANYELRLTDGNRTATRVWSSHRSTDHPERFERCPQVLCREGLLDSVYWEVEWRGGADIGVTYNNICRNGDTASCLLGHNERSWSLECSEGHYTPCHANKRFKSSSPQPFSRRVGVYLDWSAGALSFYCITKDAMLHLHTFDSTFSEPLYPGFWVWSYNGSVTLCHVELDWERLLQ